jgi:1,4-alpha-glucan branching enzyme
MLASMPKHLVHFALLAPNNPEVNLLGSWNSWQSHAMRQEEDGYWRIEVPLDDGEHQYIFEVISRSPDLEGRRIRIPDPCALEWSWDDKTRLRLQDGKRVYALHDWQHDNKPLPLNEEIIIYELHVGDFSGGEGDEKAGGDAGTFRDVIGKLNYLADLGINAIELMPVTANPPGFQMGYSQLSYFTLNYRYGSADDLAALVDACHGRGIRVIHDCVYNHMASDAIWALIDYEYWFVLNNPDDYDFGPKLNYTEEDPRRAQSGPGVCLCLNGTLDA